MYIFHNSPNEKPQKITLLSTKIAETSCGVNSRNRDDSKKNHKRKNGVPVDEVINFKTDRN